MFTARDLRPDGAIESSKAATPWYKTRLASALIGLVFLLVATYFTYKSRFFGREFVSGFFDNHTLDGETQGGWIMFFVIGLLVTLALIFFFRALLPSKHQPLLQQLEAGRQVSLFDLTHKERNALAGRKVIVTSGVSPMVTTIIGPVPASIVGIAKGMYTTGSHTFIVTNPTGNLEAFSGGYGECYVYEADQATVRLA